MKAIFGEVRLQSSHTTTYLIHIQDPSANSYCFNVGHRLYGTALRGLGSMRNNTKEGRHGTARGALSGGEVSA